MSTRCISTSFWVGLVLLFCYAPSLHAGSAKPGELDLLFTEKKKTYHSNGALASIGELGTFRVSTTKSVKGKKTLVHVLKELPVGTWKSFWSDGKHQSIESYCNKFLVLRKACKYGEKQGASKTWFSDGKLRTVRTYSHGKLEGEAISFYSSGLKQGLIRYRAGKKEGRVESWWRSGKAALVGSFSGGKKAGLWREFYSNGKLKSSRSYLNGKLNGGYEEFWSVCSPSGCFHRKMVQGFYTGGKKSGKWMYWDLQGTSISESQWKIQYSN